VLARLIAVAIRLLSATWRVGGEGRGPLEERLAQGPVVVAFLHGELLPLAALHRGLPLVALVSLSRDGDFAAEIAEALGFELARGSSSRGAVAVLRQASRVVAGGRSPAFAVDGPRGPAGVPQGGAIASARQAEVPVVWARARVRGALRLRSWDAFCIPLPFAGIRLEYGSLGPTGCGRSGLDDARRTLQLHLAD